MFTIEQHSDKLASLLLLFLIYFRKRFVAVQIFIVCEVLYFHNTSVAIDAVLWLM